MVRLAARKGHLTVDTRARGSGKRSASALGGGSGCGHIRDRRLRRLGHIRVHEEALEVPHESLDRWEGAQAPSLQLSLRLIQQILESLLINPLKIHSGTHKVRLDEARSHWVLEIKLEQSEELAELLGISRMLAWNHA
jgi:hypothetical protein